MLSLSQFRHHLFPLFNIMQSTGVTFEVVHKHKVYEVNVRHSDKKPAYTRRKTGHKFPKVLPQRIDIHECGKCGSLLIAGICMNSKCV